MGRIEVMTYPIIGAIRVVDGDTFDLHLDLGLRQYGHYRIRLRDVDAPEVYGSRASEEGRMAKEFVERWFASAVNPWVEIYNEGKFSRWIGEPYDVGGTVLSEELLEAGLAVEYRR